MSEVALEPLELQLLRTPAVREVFNAPELERLLGGEGLDLSMTDEPEALRVRLEAGLEVLERRILAGIRLALGRQARLCGLAGIILGILGGVAVAAYGQSEGALYTMVGSLGALAVVMVFLATRALRVRGDLKLLAGLRGRYRGVFDGRHDLAGLQAAAREVYEEVRVVGGELG
jgi:hypothetical protein